MRGGDFHGKKWQLDNSSAGKPLQLELEISPRHLAAGGVIQGWVKDLHCRRWIFLTVRGRKVDAAGIEPARPGSTVPAAAPAARPSS